MIPTVTEVLEEHPQGETQLEMIEKHLLKHKKITSWEAITEYKITRISQYIMILRNKGFKIETVWEKENGKRFGVYNLI